MTVIKQYNVSTSTWEPVLGQQVSISYYEATATLTLSTTQADISGLASSSITLETGQKALVSAVIDFNVTVTGGGANIGYLVVNGVSQNSTAIWNPSVTARGTVVQQWLYTAASTTTYTFKIQAKKAVASGTATAETTHSTMMIQIFS